MIAAPSHATRIKLCGVTRDADVTAAVEAGADALGFNFYPGSPRCLTLTQAQRLAAMAPPGVERVAVVVLAADTNLDRVRAACVAINADRLQVHTAGPTATLPRFGGPPVILALRTSGQALARLAELEAQGALREVAGLLIDASVPGRHGGTGQRADWAEALAVRARYTQLPLYLAGGLTPDNVAQAMRAVRPAAVDVASGVESAPGVKDAAKMRAFVSAVRAADAARATMAREGEA